MSETGVGADSSVEIQSIRRLHSPASKTEGFWASVVMLLRFALVGRLDCDGESILYP